jgi:hypothetical protein
MCPRSIYIVFFFLIRREMYYYDCLVIMCIIQTLRSAPTPTTAADLYLAPGTL